MKRTKLFVIPSLVLALLWLGTAGVFAGIVHIGVSDPSYFQSVVRELGSAVRGTMPEISVIQVESSAVSAQVWVNDNRISYVENDGVATLHRTPNDYYYPQQWGMKAIYAESAWDTWAQRVRKQIIVAVIDSGIDPTHSDLKDRVLAESYDAVNNRTTTALDNFGNSHGTHVAGIIAAKGDDHHGVTGLVGMVSSYNSLRPRLLNCRVFPGKNSSTPWSNVIRGILFAATRAQVINLSLGGPGSRTLASAIRYAVSKGVFIAASAGNSGTRDYQYPAAYPGVTSVAATTVSGNLASFSQYGWPDIAAPGQGIVSTIPGQSWAFYNGTSMASPHVAAAAAMLLSVQPTLTAPQIEQRLMSTSIPVPGLDNGRGRLNIWAAYKLGL